MEVNLQKPTLAFYQVEEAAKERIKNHLPFQVKDFIQSMKDFILRLSPERK